MRENPANPERSLQQMIRSPACRNRRTADPHGPAVREVDRKGVFLFHRNFFYIENDLIAVFCSIGKIQSDPAFSRFPDQTILRGFRLLIFYDDRLCFAVFDQMEIHGSGNHSEQKNKSAKYAFQSSNAFHDYPLFY